jgi:hypothetical protein
MLPKPSHGPHGRPVVAEPTPLGLLGLAIGCAALTPIAFGHALSPAGLQTAAMFCLFFGGGGQLVSGLLNFANRNLYGGTLLTAFSFNWFLNYWVLDSIAAGRAPDHTIYLATDATFLVIFLVFTYGFGFYSKLLFLFLLDIDLMFVFKLANALLGTTAFNLPIALCTVALGLLSLWIAFALLINPTAGRAIFKVGGPLFRATPAPAFDFAARRAIFDALYGHWRTKGFAPLPLAALQRAVADGGAPRDLLPDLAYLEERGGVRLERAADDGGVTAARLTGAGVDVYEERVLGKNQVE